MTTTNSIDRVGGTATDISVKKMAEADLKQVRTEALSPSGARTTYTMATGDDRYPTTVVVQAKPDYNGNKGKGVRSCLMAINTFARTETDGVIDVIEPLSAVLSFSIPMNVAIDVADLHDLLENLFSLGYETVTTKEGDDIRLAALLQFGITEVFD